jgi:UDP-glucose:(heptosyl)LPS alpha-1,3-glucosyltransferase
VKIAINHTRFSRTGGIERHIAQLVERLLADGHEVHYFARRWEPYAHPRLRFHWVPALPLGEGIKALSFAYASALRLAQQPFDVIHGFSKTFRQDIYTDGGGAFEDYAAYLRTAGWWRRLSTFRPLWSFAARHLERRRLEAPRPPRILAMSHATRAQLLERHPFPPERVEVLHGGVDLEAFHPRLRTSLGPASRARRGAAPGSLIVLFLGNDYRRKGLDVLIEALARLRRPDLLLWVVGRDRRAAAHEAAARQAGVAAAFLGPLPDPREALAAADFFVLPSRFDSFGAAGLEALAMGLPCILSAAAGVHELLTDGEDGLVLPSPLDPGQLAAQIEQLRGDPDLRAALGAAGRRTAEGHGLERAQDEILQRYALVAGEKCQGGQIVSTPGDARGCEA